MPVLLLAQGDPQAKDMLRRAIEARYALSPPAIDSLILDFNGKVRTKVGPLTTWIPLHIRASFRFPTALRWDFTARPVGVPVRRGVEAYDGTTYRQARGRRTAVIIEDVDQISSLRHQLWAMAAVLLTPLGDHFVKLETTGENSLTATNTKLGDAVHLQLRTDQTLEQVSATCRNPDNGQTQTFSLRLSAELSPVNDIMLPRKIEAFWDNQPYYQAQPIRIENRTTIPDEVFTLEQESTS